MVYTCCDWNIQGAERHRKTTGGYADPDVADDLALRVIERIEILRQRAHLAAHQVALCGVDNSTSAFAMAVLRLCSREERYRFCSGRKCVEWEDEAPEDGYNGQLDDHSGYDDVGMWVMIDDDICSGRGLRTVATRHENVHWFGIHNYHHMIDFSGEGEPDEWWQNVTLHWWGNTLCRDRDEPQYQTVLGEECYERRLEYWDEEDTC